MRQNGYEFAVLLTAFGKSEKSELLYYSICHMHYRKRAL